MHRNNQYSIGTNVSSRRRPDINLKQVTKQYAGWRRDDIEKNRLVPWMEKKFVRHGGGIY